MTRLAAAVLTAALMGLLLWSGLRRTDSNPAGPVPPGASAPELRADARTPAEDCVRSLLASARDGDVSSYLAAFTGKTRGRLEREVNERGRDAFADDLRRASATRKSHAVFAAVPEGPDAATVTLEAVYPDRNERQSFRVEKTDRGWLVAGVETVKSRQPGPRFGAPAAFLEPEGVPVPAAETADADGENP